MRGAPRPSPTGLWTRLEPAATRKAMAKPERTSTAAPLRPRFHGASEAPWSCEGSAGAAARPAPRSDAGSLARPFATASWTGPSAPLSLPSASLLPLPASGPFPRPTSASSSRPWSPRLSSPMSSLFAPPLFATTSWLSVLPPASRGSAPPASPSLATPILAMPPPLVSSSRLSPFVSLSSSSESLLASTFASPASPIASPLVCPFASPWV
mmetsp:Transcript_23749/g.54964  ORF Transcript_23749/g.54964 Transcript_23749/m.54964 type:complete len:211 (-) Transcript_23749:35-667(-)